jgi:16S rRNA C1402 (ribose-2'-O) methylase RsmI
MTNSFTLRSSRLRTTNRLRNDASIDSNLFGSGIATIEQATDLESQEFLSYLTKKLSKKHEQKYLNENRIARTRQGQSSRGPILVVVDLSETEINVKQSAHERFD